MYVHIHVLCTQKPGIAILVCLILESRRNQIFIFKSSTYIYKTVQQVQITALHAVLIVIHLTDM